MTETIIHEQVYNFFDKFTEKEISILIGMIPKEVLLLPIKKNTKEFKKDIAGANLGGKSKILDDRLPKIYQERIFKGDRTLINHLKESLEIILSTLENKISSAINTNGKNYIENALFANDMEIFEDLIDLLLDLIKEEQIVVYFKLLNYTLTDNQKYYLEYEIHFARKLKNKKNIIIKDLSELYEGQIIEIRSKHDVEIQNLKKFIKELEEKNSKLIDELKNEKDLYNTLIEKIKALNLEEKLAREALERSIIDLKLSITQLEEDRNLLNEELSIKSNTIEKLEIVINSEYERIYDEIKKQWALENENLLKMHKNLTEECEKLRDSKQELQNSNELLNARNISLENKIISYSETLKDMETNFTESINRSISEHKSNLISSVDLSSRPFIRKGKKYEIEYLCENLEDFAGHIATNLESIGVKDISDEITDFIIGILSSGITPLICGYKSREIASAVSMAYCGETPYIITLPTGYSNPNEIMKIFHSCDSHSVLIEDAIGTMNENTLLPLLRELLETGFHGKLLLLATENTDFIKYMPSHFLNYIALVRVGKFQNAKKTKYISSNGNKVLGEVPKLSNVDYEMKQVNKLISNLGFTQPYSLSRANIVSITRRLSSDMLFTLQSYLRAELAFLATLYNKQNELENNIQLNNFDNSLKVIIREIQNV